MPPPFICIGKKNTMDEEKRDTIVLVSVITIVIAILFGIIATQVHQGHLSRMRETKWYGQVDSILNGLDSIPVTVSVTDRWTEKIDSVWLECPVTVSVTGRWTKKIDSDQSDSEEVFVGAYSNTDPNAAQKYLSDWLNATKSFCSRKTNAYTEYKTCMELVTAKATVTRKPGRPSAPPRQYTYNKFYERHSIPYPGESHTDIYLLDASTNVDWRDDSTMVTVRERASDARLHYNYRTDRWELQGAGRVKPHATGRIEDLRQYMLYKKELVPDSATFAGKMSNPAYAEDVRQYMLDMGEPVPDSATFYNTYGKSQALNKGEQL